MLTKLYQWMLAKAAHPHAERWLFAFSFMESSFFPIPPHPLLGLMCLAEPKKAVRFAMIATFASVLGGLVMLALRGEVPVLVDGGVRRGTDIATALCLGADAVLRPGMVLKLDSTTD